MVKVTDERATMYIPSIFQPLQGVFNFIAYIFPTVKNAKKGPKRRRTRVPQGDARNDDHTSINTITWRRAFVKAYMSKGPKKTSRQYHGRSNISSNNGSQNKSPLNMLDKLRTSTTVLLSRNK